MTDTPVIPGERVRLRPTRLSDAEALHDIFSDVEAMTWWTHAPYERLEETEAKVAQNMAETGWQAWTITLADDDTAIGTLGAHEERQGRVAEIGYSLVRHHWGKGLAREAVGLAITYLFEVEGYRRIFADTDPDNAPSNKLLTQLGFTLEGRLRGHWETHIGVRDSLIWGLLREEWSATA